MHHDRARDLHRRIGLHRVVELTDRVGEERDVGVHQQHARVARFDDADVPRGAGAVVPFQPAQPRRRVVPREPIASAVRAAHVDQRHPIVRAPGPDQRVERGRQRRQIVVRDDDDLDIVGKVGLQHRRGHRSSAGRRIVS
jgi:hypothetical protein